MFGKKKRENVRTVSRVVRDFKNYSQPNFIQLLKNNSWDSLINCQDPNEQWEFLYEQILEILSVMCPFKRYRQLEVTGIFLGNILKYQNDHSDKFGGAILAQQGGFLTISCLL